MDLLTLHRVEVPLLTLVVVINRLLVMEVLLLLWVLVVVVGKMGVGRGVVAEVSR